MNWTISNSVGLAYNIYDMCAIPKEIGIEIMSEFGNSHYWNAVLPTVLEGRGGLSGIHGPFYAFDLSAPDCDLESVIKSYTEGFELCQRFGSKRCVCHTHATKLAASPDLDVQGRQARSLERVAMLAGIGKQYGVTLLIENLQSPKALFDQAAYTDCFKQLPEVDSLVDIGHALVTGWDIPVLMRSLGERIKAYHVHDNDGKRDQHQLPGMGIMDWVGFARDFHAYTPDAELVLEYVGFTVDDALSTIPWLTKLLQP